VFVPEPGPLESRRFYRKPLRMIDEFGARPLCDLCFIVYPSDLGAGFEAVLMISRTPAPPPPAQRRPLTATGQRQLDVMASLDLERAHKHARDGMHPHTLRSLRRRDLVVYDWDLRLFVVTAAGRAEVAR
jgi:hypothetical protein